MYYHLIDDILQTKRIYDGGEIIGHSVEGRPIYGYRFGQGSVHISLIGGCHADEPVGPRLLRKLVAFLSQLGQWHPLKRNFSWWIVPHVNPDGEVRNQQWYQEDATHYHIGRYLKYVSRERPGRDIEFGFPISGEIDSLRPENQAVYNFWQTVGASGFHLHASLHGMSMAYGPWFLIDPYWKEDAALLQEQCRQRVRSLGYSLHDIDRKGEKGFERIAPGFCTRPNHKAMRAFFLSQNNTEMASLFHPSSMESIRSLGGNCLTLVSEMPLFLLPGSPKDISWPNKAWTYWKICLGEWKMGLMSNRLSEEEVKSQAEALSFYPMPIEDQMRLQWQFICSGIDQRFSKEL